VRLSYRPAVLLSYIYPPFVHHFFAPDQSMRVALHQLLSSRYARRALRARQLACAASVVLFAGCHKGADATAPSAAVASITVTPATGGTVVVGQTLVLAATTYDASGKVLTGRVETWTSSNTALATVAAGVVTGIAPGTVTITVTSETVTGTAAVVVTPVAVGAGPTLSALSAGFFHTCGVTLTGAAVCWGDNSFGQLGNATTTNAATPVTVAGGFNFKTVSAGFQHTCGVTTSGAAYCWGDNASGELGSGISASVSSSPVAVTGGLTFKAVSAGFSHACGLTTAGAAYCWGSNEAGDLGNGAIGGLSSAPVAVAGGLTFASLSAGAVYSCGVTTSGAAYCWGGNGYGVLGNGTTTDSPTPVAVSGGLTFSSVSAGEYHTCGVTTAGATYCWGNSVNGQLGTGVTTVNSSTPVAVIGGFTATAVSAGNIQTCALATGGIAYCWGDNSLGELGNGSTSVSSPTPLAVIGGLTFSAITSGISFHTCGLTTSGAAYCWGDNDSGALGNGTTGGFRSTPVPVVSGS
jgi:alpha-tubulin suppressor-like RCC1 family protein